MNFNVSAWAIRNPVPPILLFVVLCLLGLTSFMRLPITQFPNIDVPLVAVSVGQSGAAPAELETQITKRIEDSVAAITGVKNIVSTISDGNSQTVIEFRLEVPTDRALEDVKDAVAKVRTDLPSGIDEPIIQRIDVEGQSIQTYAVAAPAMTLEELSWYVDDVVKRRLQGLAGVGRVSRYGGVDREIRVDLDPSKLQALGVTAADVNRGLSSSNVDLGAGRGEVGGKEQAIRTLGGARTIEDLRATRISLPGGRQIRLEDVATVTDSNEEPRSYARYNGDPVVTFSIFRAKGSSSTEVGERVAKAVEDLKKTNSSVNYTLVDDTVYFIYGNYEAAMMTLIEGALLAVLVVLLFLRDWRATLISAIALPLSAIPTFWVMDLLGFSLNLVSFLGITLATGILVDDAIVEIENIARHMRMGKSAYRAALEAADEIGLAVIAISLTIIAVFVPVSFMGGIVGQYFKQFGMTVAVAVAFSLLVARLITPMMAAYLMRDMKHHEKPPGLMMRGYIKLIRFLNWAPAIKRKQVEVNGEMVQRYWRPRVMSYVTIVLAFGTLVASTLLIPLLPTGFIPRGDESRFVLSIELPPGSRLEDTQRVTSQMAAIAQQNPEVDKVFVLGGSTPTGTVAPHYASLFVNLKKRDTRLIPGLINGTLEAINQRFGTEFQGVEAVGRAKPQWDIEDEILPKLAGIPDIRWHKINDRGEREVTFNMLSNDPKALSEAVGRLEVALRGESTMMRQVSATGAQDRPELKITPRKEEAVKLGITAQQISEAVRVATIGDFGPLLAQYNAGDRLIPIRVQIPEKARTSFSEITNLKLIAADGQAVPLSSVADIEFSRGPSSIERFNRQRQAKIGADIVPGVELGEAAGKIAEVAKGLNFPASVKIQEGGDAEIQGEVNTEFTKAIILGVVLMLAVLVLLLGNIFQPFAILLSLPLSIGGVVLALYFTNKAISMPVTIGILMLIGIVAKNAIMLIDFAVERVRHGMDRVEAIVDAGRKRARPIVMTTIAMAAGMLPSAYGIGEGGTFRSPMAIGVIGGLIVSTFLSLVFVPSFYIVMDDLARLTSWVFGRFIGKTDEPPVVNEELEAVKRNVEASDTVLGELRTKLDGIEDKLEEAVSSIKKKPKMSVAAE
jgi:hydrophobe/amphiphile efflux-1 (HAE1) family protein